MDTSDGSVDLNTSGWTAGKRRLYQIVVASGAVTSYTDWRTAGGGGASSVDAADVAVADAGGFFTGTDVEGVLQEVGAALGSPGSMAGFAEAVDDRVGALLAGVGLTVTYDDAGNVLTISLPAQPFDASAFYPGLPSASAILLRVPIARAVTFPANFADSRGSASANATGSTAFDIQKNGGASVGTMTFAAGASTATFTSSGGASVSFAAGDYLSVIAPATPDATLADVGFVLAGTR